MGGGEVYHWEPGEGGGGAGEPSNEMIYIIYIYIYMLPPPLRSMDFGC